jgi:hypothetical protein
MVTPAKKDSLKMGSGKKSTTAGPAVVKPDKDDKKDTTTQPTTTTDKKPANPPQKTVDIEKQQPYQNPSHLSRLLSYLLKRKLTVLLPLALLSLYLLLLFTNYGLISAGVVVGTDVVSTVLWWPVAAVKWVLGGIFGGIGSLFANATKTQEQLHYTNK